MKTLTIIIVIFLPLTSLPQKGKPIDARATKETKALYKHLHQLSKKHTLFGHQHATEYGHGWEGDEDRSDVKSVTGSHPAVIGIDFSGFSGADSFSIQRTKERNKKIAED